MGQDQPYLCMGGAGLLRMECRDKDVSENTRGGCNNQSETVGSQSYRKLTIELNPRNMLMQLRGEIVIHRFS